MKLGQTDVIAHNHQNIIQSQQRLMQNKLTTKNSSPPSQSMIASHAGAATVESHFNKLRDQNEPDVNG